MISKGISRIFLGLYLLFFVSVWTPSFASDTPVIIRDTDIAEGIEPEEPPKERNPAEADKNISIGNYYNKQKNYVGAIGRYLTALEYQPDSTRAYKALSKAYASFLKSLAKADDPEGRIKKALDIFEEYLRNNPDSPRLDEFSEKVKQLRKKYPN